MENNENKEKTVRKSCVQGDLRTFCIALLTTVIVLALYHFGTGVYAIFCGTGNYCSMPVTREYVLVPVMSLPQHGPEMQGGPRHFRKGKRGMMPRGPEMKGHGPGAEMQPAPEDGKLPPPPPEK